MGTNNASELSEDEKAVRQSKIRAAIQHWLNNNQGSFTVSQIAKGLESIIQELNYSTQSLYSILPTMTKAGVIKMTEAGGKHYYHHPRWEGHPLEHTEPTVKRIKRSTEAVADIVPPSQFTVDVVKSTGRVRITTQGLTIEIGIVEK